MCFMYNFGSSILTQVAIRIQPWPESPAQSYDGTSRRAGLLGLSVGPFFPFSFGSVRFLIEL